MFLGYNITFIQHQGRYLFPALPLIAMGMSLGLQQLRQRPTMVMVAVGLVVGIIFAGGWGVIARDMPSWWIFLLGSTVFVLLSTQFVPPSWHALYAWGVVCLLALLDIVCLFQFIVPMLS
jgi:hypothetical protein